MCPEPPWPVVLEVMSKAKRHRCLEKEAIIFHLKIQTLKITMPFSSLYPAFPIWGRTKTCQGQRRTLYLFSRRFWSHRAEPPGLYHSFGQPILLVSLVQRD